MATNPTGKGIKTIGLNMPKEMADEIESRAKSMHLSNSKYIQIILMQWLTSGKKLKLAER